MGDGEDASDGYGRSEPEDRVKLKGGLGKTCVSLLECKISR